MHLKNVFHDSAGAKNVTIKKTGSPWPPRTYIQWERQILNKELHDNLNNLLQMHYPSPKIYKVLFKCILGKLSLM